jgi:peroxiredoxin
MLFLIFVPVYSYAVSIGQIAPDFDVKPINKSKLLNTIKQASSLRDFQGQVVYLDFWASWCPPCRTSMPLFDDLHRKYQHRGLVFIGISEDATIQEAQYFMSKVPVTFPLLWDKGGIIASDYSLLAMPYAYLIDKKGNIRYIHQGFKTSDISKIENNIQQLLNE